MSAQSISISGDAALAFARALASGLSPKERREMAAVMLRMLDAGALKELYAEHGLVTAEEAAEMAHWTPSGFLRVATRENIPHLKLGHKQPPLFRFADVDALFKTLRIWPKGKPVKLEVAA